MEGNASTCLKEQFPEEPVSELCSPHLLPVVWWYHSLLGWYSGVWDFSPQGIAGNHLEGVFWPRLSLSSRSLSEWPEISYWGKP